MGNEENAIKNKTNTDPNPKPTIDKAAK